MIVSKPLSNDLSSEAEIIQLAFPGFVIASIGESVSGTATGWAFMQIVFLVTLSAQSVKMKSKHPPIAESVCTIVTVCTFLSVKQGVMGGRIDRTNTFVVSVPG